MVAAHPCSLVHALPTNYPLTDYPLASPDLLLTLSSYHTSTSSLAAPLAHAGCNGSHHLAVGALGVMNGVEDRDRLAYFPSFHSRIHARSRSSILPAVLPAAAAAAAGAAAGGAAAEGEAEAEFAAEEEHFPRVVVPVPSHA